MLEQLSAPSSLTSLPTQNLLSPEGHTQEGHKEGLKPKPGRVSEAQTQLEIPVSNSGSLWLSILDKSHKRHQGHSSTLAFPSCSFLLPNRLALLAIVIFPPQLKFDEAALGSDFGSSCDVYYQCGQVFIPLTAIYHTPFD